MIETIVISNLPNDIQAKNVEFNELRTAMKNIWSEVFPRPNELHMPAASEERQQKRKEIAEKFIGNVFALNILFTEKSSGQPIGWIMGEQTDFETFYLRSSGFIPKYRRQQIYTTAHAALEDFLKKRGFERIASDHMPNNKPMLILKIRNDYVINNMTLDERFGPMVRLVKLLHSDRQSFYEEKFRLPKY